MKCPAQLSSGGICNKKARSNGFCGRHDLTPKEQVTYRDDYARAGERRCEYILRNGMKVGGQCSKMAGFYADGYYCSVHSTYGLREKLKPKLKLPPVEDPLAQVKESSAANLNNGVQGQVRLRKIHPFLSSDYEGDYLNVFPDTTHSKRSYSFPGLCPSRIGPVEHGYPGLPPACTLQAFTDYSRCYTYELHGNGDIDTPFLEQMKKGFSSGEVRAKPKRKDTLYGMVEIDGGGKAVRMTDAKWRMTYCQFYEGLIEKSEDYQRLMRLREEGVNFSICSSKVALVANSLACGDYNDYSVPYEHEKVLYAMLTLEYERRPWRVG